jgi:hypothetical protein
MKKKMNKSHSNTFIAGGLAFGIAEVLWLDIRLVFGESSNWVLEPTIRIILAGILIVSASIWCGLQQSLSRATKFTMPLMMYLGSCLSATIALFIVGPGNLWPIVLVFDYIITAFFFLVGFTICRFIQKFMPSYHCSQ